MLLGGFSGEGNPDQESQLLAGQSGCNPREGDYAIP
jgi:hypothetical protein